MEPFDTFECNSPYVFNKNANAANFKWKSTFLASHENLAMDEVATSQTEKIIDKEIVQKMQNFTSVDPLILSISQEGVDDSNRCEFWKMCVPDKIGLSQHLFDILCCRATNVHNYLIETSSAYKESFKGLDVDSTGEASNATANFGTEQSRNTTFQNTSEDCTLTPAKNANQQMLGAAGLADWDATSGLEEGEDEEGVFKTANCLVCGNSFRWENELLMSYQHIVVEMKNFESELVEALKNGRFSLCFPKEFLSVEKFDNAFKVLQAVAMFRPDVGHVQGMCRLVMMLVLHLDPYSAFVCMENLMCRPLIQNLFSFNLVGIHRYISSFQSFIDKKLSKVSKHFKEINIAVETFLIEWMQSYYIKFLPNSVCLYVWDRFMSLGDIIILQTALAIIGYFEDIICTFNENECQEFLYGTSDHLSSIELHQFRNVIKSFNLETSDLQQEFDKMVQDQENEEMHNFVD